MAELNRINYLLGCLEEYWQEVPVVASQINLWDTISQVDYVIDETPSAERLLEELLRLQEEFTFDQHKRFDELEKLIEGNRSVLAGIIDA